MTRYTLYCPLCGETSVARVNGQPTDLTDGYTFCALDGYSYIHEQPENYSETKDVLSSRTVPEAEE